MLEHPGAERYCIASAYKYADAFLDIDGLISPLTFSTEENQVTWKIIKALRDEDLYISIDFPTFLSKASELHLDSFVEDPNNKTYIKNLINYETDLSNVRKFASIIKNLEFTRGILNEVSLTETDLTQVNGTEGIDHIAALAQNRIFDYINVANTGGEEGVIHVSNGADDYFQYLVDNDPTDIVGISSGYPIWDSFLGGQRRQAVNLIGARSGQGKSQIADNVCKHVAGNLNIPTLYLDTEMAMSGHWHRLWSNVAEVDSREIENSKFKLNDQKFQKVKAAKDYINSIPYYYKNIAGKPFEDTLSFIRRWLIRSVGYDENGRIKDCLVVYDYLKMMSGEGISNDMKEYQILGFQMTGLHNFAVKYDIPILSFVQLNRDGIDKESTDIISQSDRLLWLASSVSIYKPKSVDEMAASSTEGNMKLIVAKNRYGGVNGAGEYINMKFQGNISRVSEGKLSSQVTKSPKPKNEFEVTQDENGEKKVEFNGRSTVRSKTKQHS